MRGFGKGGRRMEMASEKTLRALTTQAGKGTHLEELARKTLDLQVADKFRLAAMLLDQNIVELAETVATRALQEIELAQFLSKK